MGFACAIQIRKDSFEIPSANQLIEWDLWIQGCFKDKIYSLRVKYAFQFVLNETSYGWESL